MRKHFLSVITIFLLFCLTACSGLIDEYSSVSVTFPEGTSNQLTAMRAAANTSSFTCTLKTEGDYETSISKSYAKLTDLDGAVFELNGIPVNKKLRVKLQLSLDGTVYYEGTSNKITIKKGENTVDLQLKATTGKVGLGIDFRKKVEIALIGSGNSLYKGKIPSASSYEFAPVQNGEVIKTNATVNWYINNVSIDQYKGIGMQEPVNGNNNLTLVTKEDSNIYADENGHLHFNEDFIQFLGNILSFKLYCVILDGNNSASASGEFEISYPNPNINSSITTDIVLWISSDYNNYSAGPTVNNMTKTVTAKAFALKQGSGVYYIEGYNGKVKDSTGTYTGFDFTATNNIFYTDLENNNISYLMNESSADVSIQVFDLTNEMDTDYFYEIPTGINFNSETRIATSINNTRSIYSYSFTDQGDLTYVTIVNNGKVNTININKYFDYPNMQIMDMLILNDYLLILASTSSENSGFTEVYQKGAIISINLNNTKEIKVFGVSDTSYNVNYYESRDSQLYEKSTKVYGNKSATANTFFSPQRFIAIKEEELYIADSGAIYADAAAKDFEDDKFKAIKTNVQRIVSVNLKDFSINHVEDVSQNYTFRDASFSAFN